MIRPQWQWRLEDAEGTPVPGTASPVFTIQYDAEQWLGEHWRTLARGGAVSARLMHDGAQATATIPLPAQD
ncbi:hypothetical protein CLV28_1515 [Sediminihabitans luteus]|uniref:Uncharacterized protein n=1 Tax=Sediminihabitans luteus TaxID=1138585 RepID=A0A2M9CQ24_9CELL|nr:hypothetical protein [Sediminihabitans luteus]PJJ74026.1 hypothetical protein CLV28_1515 [Sediminihabitans luteus]GII98059.1 hypothetical protein Slu03_04370 [Sediminihabitans luteus]